jgi:GNAT superfamily N-acetyltransferase
VDTKELLALFDEQMRRPNRPDGSMYVGDGWSAVIRPPADGDVEPLVARMREVPDHVEWKYYSHDGPELRERLLAAGLVPDEEETVLVAEAASLPSPPPDVELRVVTDEFVDLAAEVFGRRYDLPKDALAVVAVVDGRPVSGGRVDLYEDEAEFAGLFGGVTLPEFRGRGLYRATVAKRAEIAREHGYRYVYVDAAETSRPILERLGFVRITTTTPFTLPSR